MKRMLATGLMMMFLVGCKPWAGALPQGGPRQVAEPRTKSDPGPPNVDIPDTELDGGPAAGKKNSDCPLFGGTPQRNMVNLVDKNLPIFWSVEEGKEKNIKWVADVGDKSYGGPVIADGKVFVGTNNARPRDPKIKKNGKAILMAFNEADGKFLWQIVHDFPNDPLFMDAINEGLCSTPVVEGKKLYYVTPGCEVVCADTAGKVHWSYDMMKELKVVPHHLCNCSPLIAGDLVMVVTGNGVDSEGELPSPKAPSFVAFNKNTGKITWQSSLPGKKIIEGQWSNPTLATVNGKQQVIFPGGDCVLYSFEPETGDLIWKCDCNPVRKKKEEREMDNYIMSTPVVVGARLYLGLGPYPEHPIGSKSSHVLCLDITKKGDVSLKSYDAKAAVNKGSALVWAYGGLIEPRPEKGRHARFGSTISTACVHDGLVFIPEERGYLHCLDAKTGARYWEHDFRANIWGSAYYADGKVYIGAESGEVFAFVHGKERKWYVDGKVRVPDGSKGDRKSTASMEATIHSTPVVANGVLYITTSSRVYAIQAKTQ